MRQGEMIALRFKHIDFGRGLITLRGETTRAGGRASAYRDGELDGAYSRVPRRALRARRNV
jgi:integrase